MTPVCSSPSVAHEGRGMAMLVGRLDASITCRDISEASSAAEYLLYGSDLRENIWYHAFPNIAFYCFVGFFTTSFPVPSSSAMSSNE